MCVASRSCDVLLCFHLTIFAVIKVLPHNVKPVPCTTEMFLEDCLTWTSMYLEEKEFVFSLPGNLLTVLCCSGHSKCSTHIMEQNHPIIFKCRQFLNSCC